MAQHSDGAIVVSTKIDNSGVKPGTRQFKAQLSDLESSVAKAGRDMAKGASIYTQAMQKSHSAVRGAIEDQEALIKSLVKAHKEANEEIESIQKAAEAANEYRRLAHEFDALMKSMREVDADSEAFQKMNAELESIGERMADIGKMSYNGIRLKRWADPGMFATLQSGFEMAEYRLRDVTLALNKAVAMSRESVQAEGQVVDTTQDAVRATEEVADAAQSAANAETQIAEAAEKVAQANEQAARWTAEEWEQLKNAGSAVSDAQRNMERAAGINSGDVFDKIAEAEERIPEIEDDITAAFQRRDEAYSRIVDRSYEAEGALQRERVAAESVSTAAAETAHGVEEGASGWDRVLQVTDGIEAGANSAAEALAMGFSAMRTAAGGAASFLGTMANLAESAGAGLLELGYRAARAAVHITKIVGSAAINGLKRLASGAARASVQLARLAGSGIRSGLRALGSLLSKAASSTLSLFKRTKQSNTGINLSLKNILRYGFGIRSLFALFNRLRRAIKDGFEQMAKSNPEVKASLKSLSAALNGLKGSLASAFAPILTAVAPALTTLINILTDATNAVGMFLAALTGKAYYQASKGVASVGNAASGSSGKVKELKRELAGFDQLDILKDSSGGSGGGGGGSGSGLSFDTLPVDSGIKDFIEQMKALFQAGDFEEIGRIVADGINGALDKARQIISWDNLGKSITEGVSAVTGIFNSLVDNIDWTGIGKTFGTGANTFIKTVNLAFDKTNFQNLGKGIADALNGLVNTIDWTDLGAMFRKKINAVLDVLTGAVSGFKWGNAGKAFADALNGLYDRTVFDNLSALLSTGINGVVQALWNIVSNFDWGRAGKDFGKSVSKLINDVDWTGLGNLLRKALDSALDGLLGIVTEFKWGNAGAAFSKTIKALYDPVAFVKLAGLFSTGINGAIEGLTSIVSSFQWGQAGKDFAAGVNKLVNDVDWAGLGGLFKNGITAALDALLGFVTEFKWGDVGTKFASAIKALYDPLTFVKLGSLLSTGINGATAALGNALSGFEWGNAGADFAASVNKLVNDVDWVALGKNLGKALQTAIDALKNFVINLDWKEAGKNFAKSLNALLDEIKPEDITETISTMLKGAIDWAAAFLQDFDAYELGVKINQAIASIDWDDIKYKLGTMVHSLFSDLGDIAIGAVFGSDLFSDNFITDFMELIAPGTKEKLAKLKSSGISYSDLKKLGSGGNGPEIIDVNERQTKAAATFWGKYALEEFNKGRDKTSIIQDLRDLGKSTQEINEAAWALGMTDKEIAKVLGELDFGDAWSHMLEEAPELEVQTTFVSSDDPNARNGGLMDYLRKLFAPGVDTQTRITLLRQGWTSLSTWIGTDSPLSAFIGLARSGWTTLTGWLGLINPVFAKIGLEKYGWTSIAAFVGTSVNVLTSLQKNGWTSIGGFVGTAVTVLTTLKKNGWTSIGSYVGTAVTVLTSLGKNGWTSIAAFVGTAVKVLTTLARNGWTSIAAFVGTAVNVKVALKKNGWTSIGSFVGKSVTTLVNLTNRNSNWTGGIAQWITGNSKGEATIKVNLTNGAGGTRWVAMTKALGGVFKDGAWSDIPQYASGTLRAGSIFAAGEAGPELVGHIGGRTEVLNRSQLAATMYAAVSNGMLNALSRLRFRMPAVATGTLMPYEVSAQLARSTADIQGTLDANNEDLIQTIISVAGQIVAAVRASSNGGATDKNEGPTAAQLIDEINRRTLMMGASPIMS